MSKFMVPSLSWMWIAAIVLLFQYPLTLFFTLVAVLKSSHSCSFFSFVADEDLHGQNILLLTSILLRELLRYPRESMGDLLCAGTMYQMFQHPWNICHMCPHSRQSKCNIQLYLTSGQQPKH